MRAKRVDRNQPEVVKAFQQLGCSVLDLSGVGEGCPDLLVGRNGGMVLVEVKDGEKEKARRALTPQETDFHRKWKGVPVRIVENLEDVIKAVNSIVRSL